MKSTHAYPYLHNAMWPGLVGKGAADSEPAIDLDTMLRVTAAAEVDGVKFDGVDLFLSLPHTDIDSSDDELKALAEKLNSRNLRAGSLVAPVWGGTGGGSAMGDESARAKFITQVKKACRIGGKLRDLGVRKYGVIRIDSACGVTEWAKDCEANTKRIAETFREACRVAEDYGERLAAEGEICWGGMHSWRRNVQLLEMVGRPRTLGYQADMAHVMLFTMGYNAPEDALLPADFDWTRTGELAAAYAEVAKALRPWTIDFHVAQNDGTVKGSGSHDKTGRHCQPDDANGRLDVVRDSGAWLRGENGQPTRAMRHVCWDGCMFPNAVMLGGRIWNDVLRMMMEVRKAHGWD
jgi:sugar phosphate isomerase/epimerase